MVTFITVELREILKQPGRLSREDVQKAKRLYQTSRDLFNPEKDLSDFGLACLQGNLSLVEKEYEHSSPNLQMSETAFGWGYVTLAAMGANYTTLDLSDDEFDIPPLSNHSSVIRYLIKKGAPVNCVDVVGFTPLHYAVQNLGSVPEVKALLYGGTDARIQNRYGETALHFACDAKNYEAIWLMLDSPFDLSVIDWRGFTPADLLRTFTGENFHTYEHWKNEVRKYGIYKEEVGVCSICYVIANVKLCKDCSAFRLCGDKCRAQHLEAKDEQFICPFKLNPERFTMSLIISPYYVTDREVIMHNSTLYPYSIEKRLSTNPGIFVQPMPMLPRMNLIQGRVIFVKIQMCINFPADGLPEWGEGVGGEWGHHSYMCTPNVPNVPNVSDVPNAPNVSHVPDARRTYWHWDGDFEYFKPEDEADMLVYDITRTFRCLIRWVDQPKEYASLRNTILQTSPNNRAAYFQALLLDYHVFYVYPNTAMLTPKLGGTW